MQLTRNPPDDFALDPRGLLHTELVATGPKVLGSRCISDPDIDAQLPGAAALGTPGYDISDIGVGAVGRLARLAPQTLQLKPVTLPRKVGEDVVRESVQNCLL